MSYTFDQAIEVLDYIKTEQPELKELLVFYKEILKSQLKIKDNFHLSTPVLSREEIKEKLDKGFPLLELNFIPDSPYVFLVVREELAGLIKKRGPSVALEMEKIEKPLSKNDHIFLSLSHNYILHNWPPLHNFVEAHDLDKDLLFFIIKNSVKPFVEAIAEKISNICDFSLWAEAFCPICGSMPALAFLKPVKSFQPEDLLFARGKKRYLACSLCHHQWPFPRLKCPFCFMDKPNTLRYFYLDSGSQCYRVDVCHECHSYIKTIDGEYNHISESLLFLEDIKTIHLDFLAEQEGYSKKAEGIFSP